MEKQIFHLPKWVIILYATSAIVLIPWTYGLAESLPTFQTVHHWDTAWVGFDIFIICLLILTVFLAIVHSIWLSLTATSLSTLLVIDAWFDVLTANPGRSQIIALGFAAFIELPLAVLTYIMAHDAILHLHNDIQSLKNPLTDLVSSPNKSNHNLQKNR